VTETRETSSRVVYVILTFSVLSFLIAVALLLYRLC
jgi:hypothetical protein